MAIEIKHKFNNANPDGPNTALVRPSNWNDNHTITLGGYKLLGNGQAASGNAEEITFTEYVKGLLAASDAAAARTVLEIPSPPSLSGLVQYSASPVISVSSQAQDTNFKLFDVPENCFRVTIRVSGLNSATSSSTGVRMGNSGGVLTSGYSGGHARIESGGTTSVSTSSSFFTTGGFAAAAHRFDGVLDLSRNGNSPVWTIEGTMYQTVSSETSILRHSAGRVTISNPTTINLWGTAGSTVSGAFAATFLSYI